MCQFHLEVVSLREDRVRKRILLASAIALAIAVGGISVAEGREPAPSFDSSNIRWVWVSNDRSSLSFCWHAGLVILVKVGSSSTRIVADLRGEVGEKVSD